MTGFHCKLHRVVYDRVSLFYVIPLLSSLVPLLQVNHTIKVSLTG